MPPPRGFFWSAVMESTNGDLKHGAKSWTKTSMVSLLHLLLLMSVVRILVVKAAASEGFDPNSEQPCSLRDPAMDPTYEFLHGHDVVWQIPRNPKAVLLLAHGGRMESLQYFDPGRNCEQCYGLPECRKAVLESLQRRYAVISVTVSYPKLGEEVSDEERPIASEVSTIVTEWMAKYSLDGLTLMGWGHSAGSFLLTALTQMSLPMRAMVLMCGQGHLGVEEMATTLTFPPTLFVYMPRDESVGKLNITGKDRKAIAALRARGVEVAETRCFPKPLSPLFFTERILCMSEEMSQTVYGALEAAGWFDTNGYLTKNPEEEHPESVLRKANALPYCAASGDLCLLRPVLQELKMAFAVHSFTNDANDVIFPWLDSHIPSSSGTAEELDLETTALTATI